MRSPPVQYYKFLLACLLTPDAEEKKIEQTADERAIAPSPNNFDKITMVLVNPP
ncbi:MAG: hypothetical protein RM368_20385 [Nostoc sp. DedSLP03]|uniref:hypothetical protein n=1 Tax=Nostoc sp. DedSLP03 TaxID=3075400 RepID=UPI002AD370FF|nr:hypothetical protein [Nostoc sp. DedSLP03]MDZ7967302.1 hypothetical protein [Nostoc sp. DedSLP03]